MSPESDPQGVAPSGPALPAGSAEPSPPAAPAASDSAAVRPAGPGATDSSSVSIEEFARLDLRVARVIAAERHPKADRLLKLQVEVAGEARQIVAGIAGSYRPEELVGRLIVIVANLKPARLRGEVSQGMLLAASDGEIISLLTPERPVPSGAQIR